MRLVWSWVVLVLLVARASADTDPAPDAPWQVGVTSEQKAVAQAALDRGNALYVENRYEDALTAYQQGLAAWDHPSIRFNLAATLIALDRPVDAQRELELAMRHGPRPLKDQWREALNYRALLERQVGVVELACTQPGVELELDNARLAACPTSRTERVRAGEHVIVGHKAGHLTVRKRLFVAGGSHTRETITLVSLQDAAVTKTRWAIWKPWAVTAGGAVVGALGLGLALNARATLDDYRTAIADECADDGCPGGRVSASTADLLDRAQLRDRVGVSLAVAGAIGLATGVTLLVLNRAYTEVPPQPALTLSPVVTSDSWGIAFGGRL